MSIPTYEKIRLNGGAYDTKNYRYIIDTETGDIKRCLLSQLDTTAMLNDNVWKVVKSK